jgi:hypothetical protein
MRASVRLSRSAPGLIFALIFWLTFGLTFATSPAVRAKSRAAVDPLPGRRIDRLVAGPNRLFALRGGEVVTFDGVGQSVGRCSGFASPPRREAGASLGVPDAEEVLRAAGLPDDDSTPAAEDALEDEGLGPRRRTRALPEAGVEPHALAATRAADVVWIATSSGIFRGGESGCAAAGLGGRDLVLVAATEGVVIAASEDLLFRRAADVDNGGTDGNGGEAEAGATNGASADTGATNAGDADTGATFTVAAGLASPPRALAVGVDGEAIVADDDGVLIVGPDHTAIRIFDHATDAVAVCGGIAAALSSDGVYTWSRGVPPVRVGDRPPARTLACGRSANERWIATGLGVWTSGDGATWVERTEMLGRSVAGAAAIGDRLWLAVDDRLVALDASATADERSTGAAPAGVGSPSDAGLAALPTRRLIAPTVPWPWVTAMLGTERTPVRHAWSVMVLLTFPLGRVGGRRGDSTTLASALVEWDRALAAEQADLRAATPGGDEVDARLAALQQEREALR